MSQKKVVLTGVKPTGQPHIGNFLGAMRPGLALANTEEMKSYFFIADYHSLTGVHDAKKLNEMIYEVAASWLACGLDPTKTVFYRQADVPEIFELSWILSCFSPKGLMNRAHAYKARVAEAEEAGKNDPDALVNMGLFTYPILMAADILMFGTNLVPVGEDQIQHVEIARDIAQKINRTYGEVLVVPEFVVQKDSKLVPGLDGRKMSKSYDNYIPMFAEEKKLRKLVMKIKTDSTPPEAPKDPNNSLIFDLYKEFANVDQIEDFRARYLKGISWGEAKQSLFEAMNEVLSRPRQRYEELMANRAEIDDLLTKGGQEAREVARENLRRLRLAIGIDK
ncbi:MAG: tryptophan--tRNA ligase [Bdellovibrionaceae bacterium]|nr:tryptophan--tRNA ligase [Bdellovibrionales bacterium]MCB9083333.1 tryptophan--tRNA ligase [Pseudobdellovibrionaceae bacterium]